MSGLSHLQGYDGDLFPGIIAYLNSVSILAITKRWISLVPS